MTKFWLFQKEIYYRSEGNIHENSKKDLRRSEGFAKVIHSAWIYEARSDKFGWAQHHVLWPFKSVFFEKLTSQTLQGYGRFTLCVVSMCLFKDLDDEQLKLQYSNSIFPFIFTTFLVLESTSKRRYEKMFL